MIGQNKYGLAIAGTFLWIGFVGAISFMEAWLKFQAPGITLPLGLGVGRLVFGALNKMEWVVAIAIAYNLHKISDLGIQKNLAYAIALLILILQTFWILPILDARAELIIQGVEIESSYYHISYIILEVIKVSCLMIFGLRVLRL